MKLQQKYTTALLYIIIKQRSLKVLTYQFQLKQRRENFCSSALNMDRITVFQEQQIIIISPK